MTNNNKKKGSLLSDLVPMITGESVVVALVCIGFIIIHFLGLYEYSLSVVLGALLGAAVMVINYAILILAVDKEIKRFIENRPEGEMSEEDAHLYAKKQMNSVQNAMKISSIIRLASIVATLVVAFITGWFNPVAAAIPMFAFRFILTASEMIKSKNNPKPDPSKFIKYEDEDENKKEEKEDE